MLKPKSESDPTFPPPVSSDRGPLVIACEQTNQQRVQMRMDELFQSSPRLASYEPVAFENNETLQLKTKKKTTTQSSRKRRLRTNSAAGRNRRLEKEQTAQRNKPVSKLGLFSTQTLKLATVAILASLFRA